MSLYAMLQGFVRPINEAKGDEKIKKKKDEEEEKAPDEDGAENPDDQPDEDGGTNFSFADDDTPDPAAEASDAGDAGNDDLSDTGEAVSTDDGGSDEDGGSGPDGDTAGGGGDTSDDNDGTDFSFGGDEGGDDGGSGGDPSDPAAGDTGEGVSDTGDNPDDTGTDETPVEPENPEDRIVQPRILKLSTLDRALIKKRLYEQYTSLLSLAYGMQNLLTDNKILIDEDDRDEASTILSSIIEALDLYLKHKFYINNYEINLRNYMLFSKKLDDLVAFIASLTKHKNNDNKSLNDY